MPAKKERKTSERKRKCVISGSVSLSPLTGDSEKEREGKDTGSGFFFLPRINISASFIINNNSWGLESVAAPCQLSAHQWRQAHLCRAPVSPNPTPSFSYPPLLSSPLLFPTNQFSMVDLCKLISFSPRHWLHHKCIITLVFLFSFPGSACQNTAAVELAVIIAGTGFLKRRCEHGDIGGERLSPTGPCAFAWLHVAEGVLATPWNECSVCVCVCVLRLVWNTLTQQSCQFKMKLDFCVHIRKKYSAVIY